MATAVLKSIGRVTGVANVGDIAEWRATEFTLRGKRAFNNKPSFLEELQEEKRSLADICKEINDARPSQISLKEKALNAAVKAAATEEGATIVAQAAQGFYKSVVSTSKDLRGVVNNTSKETKQAEKKVKKVENQLKEVKEAATQAQQTNNSKKLHRAVTLMSKAASTAGKALVGYGAALQGTQEELKDVQEDLEQVKKSGQRAVKSASSSSSSSIFPTWSRHRRNENNGEGNTHTHTVFTNTMGAITRTFTKKGKQVSGTINRYGNPYNNIPNNKKSKFSTTLRERKSRLAPNLTPGQITVISPIHDNYGLYPGQFRLPSSEHVELFGIKSEGGKRKTRRVRHKKQRKTRRH